MNWLWANLFMWVCQIRESGWVNFSDSHFSFSQIDGIFHGQPFVWCRQATGPLSPHRPSRVCADKKTAACTQSWLCKWTPETKKVTQTRATRQYPSQTATRDVFQPIPGQEEEAREDGCVLVSVVGLAMDLCLSSAPLSWRKALFPFFFIRVNETQFASFKYVITRGPRGPVYRLKRLQVLSHM